MQRSASADVLLPTFSPTLGPHGFQIKPPGPPSQQQRPVSSKVLVVDLLAQHLSLRRRSKRKERRTQKQIDRVNWSEKVSDCLVVISSAWRGL